MHQRAKRTVTSVRSPRSLTSRQQRRRGLGRVEAPGDVGPVDDLPERLDPVGLDVLVLQVEGVLPGVDDEQRDGARPDVALVVVDLLDRAGARRSAPRTARPSRCPGSSWSPALSCALNASKEPKCSSMAEPSAPSGLSPPSGLRFFQKIECSTWPEMWKARLFSSADEAAKSPLLACRGELLERLVDAGDVGRVVLVVVQLDDLGRVVRLQRGVVVGQVGQRVRRRHGRSPIGDDGRGSTQFYPRWVSAETIGGPRHTWVHA